VADGEDQGSPTVLDRLVRAGVSEERAREWITAGGARVNGEIVVDPTFSAPPPHRVVLFPA
jgi:hypothetical protein